MNYICTWLCMDDAGEDSVYHQVKLKSSSQAFQNVYWRCVFDFFMYNMKYNPDCSFYLFLNKKVESMVIDNVDIIETLTAKGVKIVNIDFTYKLPAGYYGSWRNQLFEFNILEYAVKNFDFNDTFLLLDSDCLIMKNIDDLFELCKDKGCVTYTINYRENKDINGLTRKDMGILYDELTGNKLQAVPSYHAGEFFMARADIIEKIINPVNELFDMMIDRFNNKKTLKFNEEAHFLSYLYFINGIVGGEANSYIKRMWNSNSYFNIKAEDKDFAIFHLPSSKQTGFKDLFRNYKRYIRLSDDAYKQLIVKKFLKRKNLAARIIERGVVKLTSYFMKIFL